MIDLRSDTVNTTKQSHAPGNVWCCNLVMMFMVKIPASVFLKIIAAEMFGTEAAIFAPSGTQSNLLALMSHCQRGDEYIVGQQAHTYRYEGRRCGRFGQYSTPTCRKI